MNTVPLPNFGEPADPRDLEALIATKPIQIEPELPGDVFTPDTELKTPNHIHIELPENIEVMKQMQTVDPRCLKIIKEIWNCEQADQKYLQSDIYQPKDRVLHTAVTFNMERHNTIKLPLS